MAECKRLIKDFEREALLDAMETEELQVRKQAMVRELNGFVQRKKAIQAAATQRQELLGAQGASGTGEGGEGPGPSGGTGSGPSTSGGQQLQQMDNAALLAHGRKKIKETDQSVARSVQVVQDTVQVAQQTQANLEHQTQQMEKVVDDLDEIKFTMKNASVLIKDITRSVATDKCIMCFLLMISAGVIGIIILQTVGVDSDEIAIPEPDTGGGGDEQQNAGSSPSPSRRLLAFAARKLLSPHH